MAANTAPANSGAIVIPETQEARVPAWTIEQCDEAVALVSDRRKAWIDVSPEARADLLTQVITSTVDVAERWSRAEAELKGIPDGSSYDGEAAAWGPYPPVRIARMLRNSMRDIAKHGAPKLAGKPTTRPDGQVVVPVFPLTMIDRALFPMYSGEVWLEPGIRVDQVQQAAAYRNPGEGELCVVLGAGNALAVPMLDTLYQLFVHNRVVILKLNPANESLGPLLQLAMAPLLREGYVRIAYGGADVGAHLTSHPQVDHLHMTGSDKTHDAIVFGVGEEGARRKAADEPVNDKPFTSELGSVSPVIIAPGEWSDEELEFQAKQVHRFLNQNSGFTCGAMRVLVTWRDWPQRDAFLAKIREVMEDAEDRAAFYPGAHDRWKAFVDEHPDAVHFGEPTDVMIPMTMLPELDASNADDIAFKVESFVSLFADVPIDGAKATAFLANAVEFCNETLWGTLGAAIIAHPKALKDPVVGPAIDKAIADLRYGAVTVNVWALMSYGLGSTTWGGFPGHVRNDIQTGIGQVGNTQMVEGIQKSVVRGPWRLGKKPPESHDFTTMGSLAPRLIQLEAFNDFTQIPGIVMDGAKG